MPQLLFTLVGEGPTDDALMPIIEWTLANPDLGLLPAVEFVPRFVGPDQLPGSSDVVERAVASLIGFPCDLLFIHHDADGPSPSLWVERIRAAVMDIRRRGHEVPASIPIVPVRETEAWLLTDESAIRRVAGKPHGTTHLGLPRMHEIESCLDPKSRWKQALERASGLSGRRLRSLDGIRPFDVASVVPSFVGLRQLPAFRAFEADVRQVVRDQRWPERLG